MLEKIVPILMAAEFSRSIEFYLRILDFEVQFAIGKDREIVEDPACGFFR